MAKYKWWKVVKAETRTSPRDNGVEYVLTAAYEGTVKEFTVSQGVWTDAQAKGGFAVS